jgi:hypothetical protein
VIPNWPVIDFWVEIADGVLNIAAIILLIKVVYVVTVIAERRSKHRKGTKECGQDDG